MKKKILGRVVVIALVIVSLASAVVLADTVDYGAKGAEEQTEYTLEGMLNYAIEDEYLAKAEYELIINEFGANRPFTNIIRAEAKHITELEELYEVYGFVIPEVDPSEFVVLPESLEAAFATGIVAENENIAMYEKFLAGVLPDDVRATFEELQNGSESHLAAFTRNADKEVGLGQGTMNASMGNGENRQSIAAATCDADNEVGLGQGNINASMGNGENRQAMNEDGILKNRVSNQSEGGVGYGNKNTDNKNTGERLYQNQKEDCDQECELDCEA